MSNLKFPNTIKMVITDFDGIVTDNCVYVDENKNMTRKLNFRDVMAFSLLKKNDIKIGIISGEKNSAIQLIAEKFTIEEVHQDIRNKLQVLDKIIEKYSLTENDYIFVGDDVNDAECLNKAKYKVTVFDAHSKIKEIKNIQISSRMGGCGAFREIIDAVLESKIF